MTLRYLKGFIMGGAAVPTVLLVGTAMVKRRLAEWRHEVDRATVETYESWLPLVVNEGQRAAIVAEITHAKERMRAYRKIAHDPVRRVCKEVPRARPPYYSLEPTPHGER